MHKPDKEYSPQDPSTPRVRGKKILRSWKIVPSEVVYLDIEGEKGILVSEKGLSSLPPYAQRAPMGLGDNILKGSNALIYLEDCLGIPLFEVPAWARAYTDKLGVPVPQPPLWYLEVLRAKSRVPFTEDYQIPTALKGQGWKHSVDGHSWTLTKVFHGRKVKIVSYGGRNLYFGVSIPTGLDPAQWESFQSDTQRVEPLEGLTVEDLEKIAEQTSAKALSWTPPRKTTDVSVVQWHGLHGREALDAWKRDVEKVIPLTLSSRKGTLTSWVIQDLLENRNFEKILGVPRTKMALMIRETLDKLAARKEISKDSGSGKILWWLD